MSARRGRLESMIRTISSAPAGRATLPRVRGPSGGVVAWCLGRPMVAFGGPMMIVDAVRDLYRARWGQPSRQARFDVGEFGIEVLKWDAQSSPEGVALYA